MNEERNARLRQRIATTILPGMVVWGLIGIGVGALSAATLFMLLGFIGGAIMGAFEGTRIAIMTLAIDSARSSGLGGALAGALIGGIVGALYGALRVMNTAANMDTSHEK